MTQELIAIMLGYAAKGSPKRHLMCKGPGRSIIRVAASWCPTVRAWAGAGTRCHAVVKQEYDRLLPPKLAV